MPNIKLEEKQEFENWNIKKQNIHFSKKRKYPKQGEIWICDLGKNIGSEQNKSRPVLVINKPLKREHTCVIIPASSTKRNFSVEVENYNFLPHQIRNIDTKRLKRMTTRLSKESLEKVMQKFSEFRS